MQKNKTQRVGKLCIDGVYRNAGKEFVGYCWYSRHKGFITRKLLKQHECLSKECHYLQKYLDAPFWEEREEKKKIKKDKKARLQVIEKREALMTEMARAWTDHYANMEITSVKQLPSGVIIITYFSKRSIDLKRCADYMKRVWNSTTQLKQIFPDEELKSWFLKIKKERIAG